MARGLGLSAHLPRGSDRTRCQLARAASVSFSRLVSSGMPGPMVGATVALITYLPLAAEGLARSTSSTTAK